jgi:hypothetical protein
MEALNVADGLGITFATAASMGRDGIAKTEYVVAWVDTPAPSGIVTAM